MKKVILSLVVSGLGISGDCFAEKQSHAFDANQSFISNKFSEVKDIAADAGAKAQNFARKAEANAEKALKRKDVQIALGTAVVIGSGVAAYSLIPGVSNFVNSNTKTVLDTVRNSDQYKLVSSKLEGLGKVIGSSKAFKDVVSSKAFKSIESSKIGNIVKDWLGIKPQPAPVPTMWEKTLGYANRLKDGAYNFAAPYVNKGYNGAVNGWNSIPAWGKWLAAGGIGVASIAGGGYYAFPFIGRFGDLFKGGSGSL